MREQPFSFGVIYGKNGDFNAEFFQRTGNILISTLLFNSFYPLLEFFGHWVVRATLRKIDRGCGTDVHKTKKTSIQSYINLYSGPTYLMHYKYSSILNVCFVTFMYGFGLPLLFPIAILSLSILFFVETGSLYYAYRMPPMYNE
jgi:hypothetical protein